MNEKAKARMEPLSIDPLIRSKGAKLTTDPAFREITAGLQAKITEMLKNPEALGACCIQGCCVSWCCVQLH